MVLWLTDMVMARYGRRWSERLPVADRAMLETRYRLIRRIALAVVLFLGIGAVLFNIPSTRAYAQTVFASSAVLGLAVGFAAWELRAPEPMLPLGLFRSRSFTMTNVAPLLMFFGMFGSIFLRAQFPQTVQHYSPLQAGLRTLPWPATLGVSASQNATPTTTTRIPVRLSPI